MRILFAIGCWWLSTCLFAQTLPKDRYIVLVSLDGFRHDYVARYQPPSLLKLIKEGTAAKALMPIYPSKTFPNHYSLITGMYADKHGILDNPFYDAQIDAMYTSTNGATMQTVWYHGTPLWQLAQSHGLKSAAFFWVGSELPLLGQYPTYYKKYDHFLPNQERVAQLFDWLRLPEAERPRLITLYFSLVDDAGHRYGPDSPEMRTAVLQADSLVGKIHNGLKETGLPVDLFVVSDHGMEQIPPDHFINVEKLVDLSDSTINFVSNSVHLQLYFKDKSKILPVYRALKAKAQNFTPYLKKDIPKHWHYTTESRTGDILVVAQPPYLLGGNVAEKKYLRERANIGGQHGYDPYEYPNMHAVFYAWGADIKEGFEIPRFDNVHIYPLIAHLLGLTPPKDIDGRLYVLKKILKVEKK